jgi:hypothetical protein
MSPEFREFFAAVKPFFDDIDEMRHYETLLHGAESAPAAGSS